MGRVSSGYVEVPQPDMTTNPRHLLTLAGTVLTLSMATWTPEGRGLYDSDLPPVCTGGLEPETPGWLRGTYINSNLVSPFAQLSCRLQWAC
jgi:hypothetical protein